MRHGKKTKKLGRVPSHRKAMLANMAASLFIHKRIKTTEAKAKEARRLVERLITYGKKDTQHARRLAFAILRQKEVVKALFEEIAPVYKTREGGYTRVYKLGRRPNDAAKVVLLELVDFLGTEKSSKPSAKKAAVKKTAVKESPAEKAAPVAAAPAAEVKEAAQDAPDEVQDNTESMDAESVETAEVNAEDSAESAEEAAETVEEEKKEE